GDGLLIMYDLKSKTINQKKLNIDGEETIIQTIKGSPYESIYLGGYQSGGLTVMESKSGDYRELKGINQIEGITFTNDEAYLGVYPGGHIHKLSNINE